MSLSSRKLEDAKLMVLSKSDRDFDLFVLFFLREYSQLALCFLKNGGVVE